MFKYFNTMSEKYKEAEIKPPLVEQNSYFFWPLSTLVLSAQELRTRGNEYYNLIKSNTIPSICTVSSDIIHQIWSYVQVSALHDVVQESKKIQSTASWQVIQLTTKKMLTEVWLSLFGMGSLFASDKDRGPVGQAMCILFRAFYYITIAFIFYFIPTLGFSFFLIGVIYYNFGGEMSFLSACCINAYMIINLAVNALLCATEYRYNEEIVESEESNKNKAVHRAAYKDLLNKSEDCIRELSETLTMPTKDEKEEDEKEYSEEYCRSPIRSAMRWHLGLFNFYDRLLQSLLKSREDHIFGKKESINAVEISNT